VCFEADWAPDPWGASLVEMETVISLETRGIGPTS
jgi:hypothetical protein